eukprot:gene6223-6460_t
MDPLLWELAVDLGGVPAGNSLAPGTQPVPAAGDTANPQNVAPGFSMPETQATPFQQGTFAGHSAVLQQLQLSAQQLQSSVAAALQQAQSLPAAFDQPPLAASLGLAASFNSLSNSHPAGAGSNAAAAGAMKSQPLQFQPAFGLAAAAQAVPRPATSHSPSSSSGGQLPDEYTEMTEQYRFKKPLNKGALAQKRFRERQKERMRQNEEQVADLTARLEQLEMEKARLESRGRLLEQMVALNMTHEARLHTNRKFMVHLQQLLQLSSGNEAAAAEVNRLMLKRREMTDRHALFSHYHWVVWCLNKSEMEVAGLVTPPVETWAALLQQMKLSKSQAAAMAAARRSLLAELKNVAAEWQKILPTLALQLLQVPKQQWHTVTAVRSMVANLAAEREAVVAFLHTLLDEYPFQLFVGLPAAAAAAA